jgi:hypothetical protein
VFQSVFIHQPHGQTLSKQLYNQKNLIMKTAVAAQWNPSTGVNTIVKLNQNIRKINDLSLSCMANLNSIAYLA